MERKLTILSKFKLFNVHSGLVELKADNVALNVTLEVTRNIQAASEIIFPVSKISLVLMLKE